MDAQLAAMEEQHEEERAMMQARWSQQVQEVGALHQTQQVQLERRRDELERQLDEVQQQNQQLRLESQRAVEQLERRHQEMLSRQAAEAESEMDELRRHYEDYLLLKNQYQELQALVEPFRVRTHSGTVSGNFFTSWPVSLTPVDHHSWIHRLLVNKFIR